MSLLLLFTNVGPLTTNRPTFWSSKDLYGLSPEQSLDLINSLLQSQNLNGTVDLQDGGIQFIPSTFIESKRNQHLQRLSDGAVPYIELKELVEQPNLSASERETKAQSILAEFGTKFYIASGFAISEAALDTKASDTVRSLPSTGWIDVEVHRSLPLHS